MLLKTLKNQATKTCYETVEYSGEKERRLLQFFQGFKAGPMTFI